RVRPRAKASIQTALRVGANTARDPYIGSHRRLLTAPRKDLAMTPRHRLAAFAFALALAAPVATPALADDDDRRTITLSGTGETMAAPDLARITSGVQTEAKTA